jgi:Raf kinase inhibitor-like YbhB/YbcL family protein
MAVLGTLLKNKHAGETYLAWNLPALAGPESLTLSSAGFEHGGTVPRDHVGKRVGGANTSPALSWTGTPEGTAQLLLVIEDSDTPTKRPVTHCVALIDPHLTAVPVGGLNSGAPAAGVRLLRSFIGTGYIGPAPIKGHGPHRYVFQLFALPVAIAVPAGGAALDKAKPRAVLDAVTGPVLARGRLDGLYER